MSGLPQVGIDGRGRLAATNVYPWHEAIKDLAGVTWTGSRTKAWVLPATPGNAAALLTILSDAGASVSPKVMALAVEAAGRADRWAAAADESTPLPDLPWRQWLTTDPWDHQKRGIGFMHGSSVAAIGAGMGTGKTLMAIGALNAREVNRTLLVAPVATFGVFPRELRLHSTRRWHTLKPPRTRKGTLRAITLADRWKLIEDLMVCGCGRPHLAAIGYEAMVRDPVASADLGALGIEAVVYDECLPAGVMIDTPAGRRPIESLCVGDPVMGVDHETGSVVVTTVRYTFTSETSKPLTEVGGVPMTANHPVWTDRGYVRADGVRAGDVLCRAEGGSDGGDGYHLRMVREGDPAPGQTEIPAALLRQGVLCALADVPSGLRRGDARETQHPAATGARRATDAGTTPASGCGGETGRSPAWRVEPLSGLCGTSSGDRNESGAWLASPQRGQWGGADAGTGAAGAPARLADRSDCAYGAAGAAAYALQAGCGVDAGHGGDRVRRPVSRNETGAGAGRPQGRLLDLTRLDGAALPQRTDFDRDGFSTGCRQVFNIETGTGNYVAGGLLVHNCHRLKAPGGGASRTAFSWVNAVPLRWGLSGTLLPQGPWDAYGLFRALDPSVFGTNVTRFMAKFIVMKENQDGQSFPKDVKEDQKLEFSTRFHSITYIPVVDLKLPAVTHKIESFELEPSARRVYESIRDDGLAEISEAIVAAGGDPTTPGDERTVAPANAGVQLLRFAQITGGTVKDDEGNLAVVSTAKIKALGEVLERVNCRKGGHDGRSRPEPVVVFARLRPELDAIAALCAEAGLRYREVSGSRRDGLDEDAKMHPECDVLGAQIASGGVGVDFTRARVNVYYSCGYELWLFQQSQARSHRPGQTRQVLYVYLVANNTVDGDIYAALARREEVVNSCVRAYLNHRAERDTEDLPEMPLSGGEVAGAPVSLPDWLMPGADPAAVEPRKPAERELDERQGMLALSGLEGF